MSVIRSTPPPRRHTGKVYSAEVLCPDKIVNLRRLNCFRTECLRLRFVCLMLQHSQNMCVPILHSLLSSVDFLLHQTANGDAPHFPPGHHMYSRSTSPVLPTRREKSGVYGVCWETPNECLAWLICTNTSSSFPSLTPPSPIPDKSLATPRCRR